MLNIESHHNNKIIFHKTKAPDLLKLSEKELIGNNSNDFSLISQLGRGSNGIIYRVKSKINGQEYVMKQINLQNLKIDIQKEAFREAQILKKVKHPNIIQYFNSFKEKHFLYIIMEYAEGGDLQKLIKSYKEKNSHFSEDEIWKFADELSSALQYLHFHKIIHRDVKSLNVFLTKSRKIKLGDLGFSKIVSNLDNLQGNRVGTPMYLAPEIIKLKPYDFKIDIWALGCVLYHISTLEPPFQGENLMMLGYNIVHKDPKTLPIIFSNDLSNLIFLMLSKNPLHRPKIDDIIEKIKTINSKKRYNFFQSQKFSNNIDYDKKKEKIDETTKFLKFVDEQNKKEQISDPILENYPKKCFKNPLTINQVIKKINFFDLELSPIKQNKKKDEKNLDSNLNIEKNELKKENNPTTVIKNDIIQEFNSTASQKFSKNLIFNLQKPKTASTLWRPSGNTEKLNRKIIYTNRDHKYSNFELKKDFKFPESKEIRAETAIDCQKRRSLIVENINTEINKDLFQYIGDIQNIPQEKRAVTAFDNKRTINYEQIVFDNKEEHTIRPNTTGSEYKIRKRFTIKDLE